MKKAIFIDKDGTLIINVPHNVDTRLIQFESFVPDAIRILKELGFELVIISNQPGVGLSYFTKEAIENVYQYINSQVGKQFSGFYYCPHDPTDECYCRKPMPGLILKAARDMDIDLKASWMIGDILNDVEAGIRAGCKTILLDVGNETEWVSGANRKPTHTCKNWQEITAIIVQYASAINNVEPV